MVIMTSKKSQKLFLEKYFYKYFDNNKEEQLLNGLVVLESLILNYKGKDIFLIHGHQADFLNSVLWRFSKFLVRYIWSIMERLGIKDFTRAAKVYPVKSKTEKKLKKWSTKNKKILISGHTHRAIFPNIGQGLYFNDGSCIHPSGITALEIVDGTLTLVKWEFKSNNKGFILVDRTVLRKSEYIINFIKNNK